SSVVNWCASGALKHFLIRRRYLIPKPYLINFMMSKAFEGIKITSGSYSAFVRAFVADES
ncbi:MAG: hypothetical protein ACOYJB_10105, partial [Christensenellaceae bacterium]